MRRITILFFLFFILFYPAQASAQPPVEIIRVILSTPDNDLSYERAKLAFDRIIMSELDETVVTSTLDKLETEARRISKDGNDIDKLKAVRHVIYESGTWNGQRPFTYDHADPYGINLNNKLLSTYLDTRLGNCVSMPILQLIVAQRLGLNVSLSTAPAHLFVRYTNPTNSRSIAIEATSGGYPTRDIWYHQKMGVTDTQVKNGIYLGNLTKRESIVVMASTVNEWLMEHDRYDEAIELSNLLLEYFPKDIHALLTRGGAYGQLLQLEYTNKYPIPSLIPPPLRPRYRQLAIGNVESFRKAEVWGQVPPSRAEPSNINQ